MHFLCSMQNYISHSKLICINVMHFYCLVENRFVKRVFRSISKTIFAIKKEKKKWKYCFSKGINSVQNKRNANASIYYAKRIDSDDSCDCVRVCSRLLRFVWKNLRIVSIVMPIEADDSGFRFLIYESFSKSNWDYVIKSVFGSSKIYFQRYNHLFCPQMNQIWPMDCEW